MISCLKDHVVLSPNRELHSRRLIDACCGCSPARMINGAYLAFIHLVQPFVLFRGLVYNVPFDSRFSINKSGLITHPSRVFTEI